MLLAVCVGTLDFPARRRIVALKKRLQGECMSAEFLPSILVPLVGLVFPAVAMASLFLYVEKEEIK